MVVDIISHFYGFERRNSLTRESLKRIGEEFGYNLISENIQIRELSIKIESDAIYKALFNISAPLGHSYAQIKLDLQDDSRISWAGTAHELRQIISSILHILAPDNVITSQSNYKQAQNASGPTQKQRVTYILQQRKADSKIQEVVTQIEKLEDLIGDVVRSFYGRASDAAHRFKDKKEVERLLKYFDAFIHDILDL